MKKIKLTYKEHISNREIKIGDIFHNRYEIISAPKITKNGYEWMIRHQKWMVGERYTGGVVLRMIRPDPSAYLAMNELEQSEIVSEYQRHFIPMQLHPYIEAFYDVRHIGGSAALFTEWSSLGTLAECMGNGSLYRVNNNMGIERFIVMNRMLDIAKNIARALQFLDEQGIFHGEVNGDNIMLHAPYAGHDCTAKLSVANLLTKKRQLPEQSDMKQWAEVMQDMLAEQKYYSELHPTDNEAEEDDVPGRILAAVIADVLNGKLTKWEDIMAALGSEPTEDYHITSGGSLTRFNGYLNNFALRLFDAGKKEDALRILDEARGGKQDYYYGIASVADVNFRKMHFNIELPLRLYREYDSYYEPTVYMEDMFDAMFDMS